MPEFAEHVNQGKLILNQVCQCNFGSVTRKPTTLGANFKLREDHSRCNYESQWLRIPWNGDWRWAPHPRLLGRQLEIPADDWHPGLLRPGPPRVSYVSAAAATYTA